jgi:hypothetical protein
MTSHIDAFVETEPRAVDEVRTAEVTKTEDQQVVGVPVFFSADDIEKQGIDPTAIDKIGIRIEDGYIVFVPAESGVE